MAIRGLEPGDRPALLISECQRGVLDARMSPFPTLVEQAAARGIVLRIGRLAAAFRESGWPVFHLHVAHRPDCADVPVTNVILARSVKQGRMRLGTPDVDPVPGVEVHEGDVLHARGFSLVAFHGTDLDQQLRNRRVTTLVVCGVSSNVAVSGTALCGSDLGYQVVVPEDCVAGASAESHAFMVQQALPLYSTVTNSDDVAGALAGLRA